MFQGRSGYAEFCSILHAHAGHQPKDQSTGKGVATASTIHDPHFVLAGIGKILAVVDQGTPAIVAGAMAFPREGCDVF